MNTKDHQIKPKQSIARRRNLFRLLGPGLITGASDNDPSGIATYSQAGAQFGYGMLWTMLLTYPFMGSIQDISARIGRVTGHGIAGNLRRYYSNWLTYSIVALMVAANTFNLAADIHAMGTALKLIVGGSSLWYGILFVITSLLLQITVPYHKYASILKWLTVTLFTYVLTVLMIHVPWEQVMRAVVFPTISFDAKYLTTLIAILGTTISPYLFFWQASQEVEELESHPSEQPLKLAPEQAAAQLNRIRLDTYVGMGFSNAIAFFIILTTAVTLNANGNTNIQTAAQAAEALRPIAGSFAFLLFSCGIIGTGLLALPVLAGSAAYGVGEALQLPTGLERKPLQAKGFYAVLTIATLVALGFEFTSLDPIKSLYWAAVLNGVTAPPVMLMMMLMATNPQVMQHFTLSRRLRIFGWLATLLMGVATIGFFLTLGK